MKTNVGAQNPSKTKEKCINCLSIQIVISSFLRI